jgi:hypothetical protein
LASKKVLPLANEGAPGAPFDGVDLHRFLFSVRMGCHHRNEHHRPDRWIKLGDRRIRRVSGKPSGRAIMGGILVASRERWVGNPLTFLDKRKPSETRHFEPEKIVA